MFERVVENWLINASEREYQIPFCQILVSQGYKVLHISVHGPQEQGKDVIAIDPGGRPVAYQLKIGDIDLGKFRRYYEELVELIEVPIQFPGVVPDGRHRCFLVTTGTLADTVRQRILDQNRRWAARRFPQLQVIVKDQLLRSFLDTHEAFVSKGVTDLRDLLRFYNRDGAAPLPREEVAKFIAQNISLDDVVERRSRRRDPATRQQPLKERPAETSRRLTSAALLMSYAVSPFQQAQNHCAMFEAWTLFAAHVLAVAERVSLDDRYWVPTFDIAFTGAKQSLRRLISEALERHHLIEGQALVDAAVYRARITILLGLMAAYDIMCRLSAVENEYSERLLHFVRAHRTELHMWGESAVPYIVFLALFSETTGEGRYAEVILKELLTALTVRNRPNDERYRSDPFPDPYMECAEALDRLAGRNQPREWERPSYDGQAYTLRTVIHLLTRRLLRQFLSLRWYDITRVNLVEMFPSPRWGMLLWKFPKGELRIALPKRPQSWADLLGEARSLDGSELPSRLRARKDFLVGFLCVYAHRLRSDTVALIEKAME